MLLLLVLKTTAKETSCILFQICINSTKKKIKISINNRSCNLFWDIIRNTLFFLNIWSMFAFKQFMKNSQMNYKNFQYLILFQNILLKYQYLKNQWKNGKMSYACLYSALWTMISNISFLMSKDSLEPTSYSNVAKKLQEEKILDFCK